MISGGVEDRIVSDLCISNANQKLFLFGFVYRFSGSVASPRVVCFGCQLGRSFSFVVYLLSPSVLVPFRRSINKKQANKQTNNNNNKRKQTATTKSSNVHAFNIIIILLMVVVSSSVSRNWARYRSTFISFCFFKSD